MSTLPSAGVLLRAAQLSIEHDTPIMLDYWTDSIQKKACIGMKADTKFLVKSDSEYTSSIQNIYNVDGCYLIMTENSLYIVTKDIVVKKIVDAVVA